MVVIIVTFAMGILGIAVVARIEKYRKNYWNYLVISGPFFFAAIATLLAQPFRSYVGGQRPHVFGDNLCADYCQHRRHHQKPRLDHMA